MNEKGSILTTVLLLAGLLILLALPVLQVANAGYKASITEQVRTQAFYLAEAGKERMAQVAIEKAKAVAATIASQVPIVEMDAEDLGAGSYSANYSITHYEGDRYLVEVQSTGKVGGSNQLARQTLLIKIVPGLGGMLKDHVLLVRRGLVPVHDGSKIIIDGQTGIGFSFDQVTFPSFPEQKIITGNQIIADGHYNAIDLKKATLTITTEENQVRIVRVPSITLENEAVIEVAGKGRLLLYVDGDINAEQDCKVTETLDGAIVELYAKGNIATSKGNNSNPQHFLMQRTLLFATDALFLVDNHVKIDGALVVDSINFKEHLTLQLSEAFKDPNFTPIGYVGPPQVVVEKKLWSPRLP